MTLLENRDTIAGTNVLTPEPIVGSCLCEEARMSIWSTSQLHGRANGLLFTTVVIVSLTGMPALAQQPAPKPAVLQPYSLLGEIAIKGTVDDIKLVDTGKKTALRLVVKTGTESIEVFLCPKSFLDDLGVSFTKGDQLEILGSKVRHDDLNEILARQIVKGNDTLVLRDKQGKPVW